MFIFDDVCDISMLESYRNKIQTHYLQMLNKGEKPFEWYPTRNIKLNPDDQIVVYTQKFLESKLRVKLECYDCEMQTWPIDSESPMHVHKMDGMFRENGDYNSLLYLNDDFNGGVFFTKTGIRIKPKKNRLTFFNGRDLPHGLTKVKKNHRHSILFWWRNTKFLKKRN